MRSRRSVAAACVLAERIKTITRQVHLSLTQLQTVHQLYLYIDLFEIAEREAQLASEKERASSAAARSVS